MRKKVKKKVDENSMVRTRDVQHSSRSLRPIRTI